jgi:hypothetical protein
MIKVKRARKIFGCLSLACGLGFLAWPLMRIVEIMRLVWNAFAELRHTGSADPGALAGEISTHLLSLLWVTLIVSPLFFLAIVFLIIFLKKSRQLRAMMKLG